MQPQPTFGKRGLNQPAAAYAHSARAIAGTAAPAALDIASVGKSDMMRAIGSNWSKFQSAFESLDNGFAPQLGFCWPALFFSGMWLLYRKQYATFFIMTLAMTAVAFVAPGQGRWINFTLSLLIVVLGKWWVVRNAAVMVCRIRSLGLSEAETTRRIERQGGTSWMAPAILFAVSAAFAVTVVILIKAHHH